MSAGKQDRTGRFLKLLVTVDILLLLVMAGIFLDIRKKGAREQEAMPQQNPAFRESDEAQYGTDLLQLISDGMLHVYYNAEAVMKDNMVLIMLSNDEENDYSVRAELVLLQENRTLAQTGLIDPGYRLEQMEVPDPPEKGEYACLLRVGLYTPDGSLLGTAGRNLLLRVEE